MEIKYSFVALKDTDERKKISHLSRKNISH